MCALKQVAIKFGAGLGVVHVSRVYEFFLGVRWRVARRHYCTQCTPSALSVVAHCRCRTKTTASYPSDGCGTQ